MEENVFLLESMCFKIIFLWIKKNIDLVWVVSRYDSISIYLSNLYFYG